MQTEKLRVSIIKKIDVFLFFFKAWKLNLNTEKRFCDKCMEKTVHEIVENEESVYTYKRRRIYKCQKCGNTTYKRGLRPSAESVY